MELRKSHWVTDAANRDTMHMHLPIAKVDKERREVSGWATLDNDDRQGDIVLADASSRAFKRFAGNIREMHQPIAVGRLVDFKEDSFFHDGRFYKGIYVTVKVSKGAQATWEKVLDGTLTGFSIGGDIKDSSTEFVKEAGDNGKNIRFIKEYDLSELSLVDTPANQLANIFSIQKSDTGSVIKGMVAETTVVNVFWCTNDGLAKNSLNETEDCNVCNNNMQNIGWFEKGEDEAAKVEETVTKFLRQGEEAKPTSEGGVTKMADENVRIEDETQTEEAPAAQDALDAAADESPTDEVAQADGTGAEAAQATDEVAQEDPDFEKMFDGLKDSVNDALKKNEDTVKTALTEVETKVSEVSKAFEERVESFQKSLEELETRLGEFKDSREGVEKRLDTLESMTAIKKSGDVEETKPEATVQKGLWAGTILG